MQGEHWRMFADSRQIMFYADSPGPIKYSFVKQQHEELVPEPIQSQPSV